MQFDAFAGKISNYLARKFLSLPKKEKNTKKSNGWGLTWMMRELGEVIPSSSSTY